MMTPDTMSMRASTRSRQYFVSSSTGSGGRKRVQKSASGRENSFERPTSFSSPCTRVWLRMKSRTMKLSWLLCFWMRLV